MDGPTVTRLRGYGGQHDPPHRLTKASTQQAHQRRWGTSAATLVPGRASKHGICIHQHRWPTCPPRRAGRHLAAGSPQRGPSAAAPIPRVRFAACSRAWPMAWPSPSGPQNTRRSGPAPYLLKRRLARVDAGSGGGAVAGLGVGELPKTGTLAGRHRSISTVTVVSRFPPHSSA